MRTAEAAKATHQREVLAQLEQCGVEVILRASARLRLRLQRLRLRLHLLVLGLLHGPVDSAIRCAAEGAGGRRQRKTLLLLRLLLLGLAEHELSRRRIHLHALRRLNKRIALRENPTVHTGGCWLL